MTEKNMGVGGLHEWEDVWWSPHCLTSFSVWVFIVQSFMCVCFHFLLIQIQINLS